MKYEPTCLECDGCRFVLKQIGKKSLVVIGLNPSTADPVKSDATMRRVMGYAERNGFDSFIMLNLYPQRTTNPNELDWEFDSTKHQANLNAIKQSLQEISKPTVLLGYGNNIGIRNYLRSCLKEIVETLQPFNPSYKIIGQYTKDGNPRHPSRGSYQDLTDVDITKLIQ